MEKKNRETLLRRSKELQQQEKSNKLKNFAIGAGIFAAAWALVGGFNK